MVMQDLRFSGEKLKAVRRALGWTQEQMAAELEMSPTYIGQMERGAKAIEKRTALAVMQIFNNHSRLASAHRVIPMQGDVPLKDAQIIWDRDDALADPVKVIAVPGDDDPRYNSSAGACNADWTAADDIGRLLRLLALFVDLIVIEKIPAEAVHNAFSVIPEYRHALHIMHFGAGVEP